MLGVHGRGAGRPRSATPRWRRHGVDDGTTKFDLTLFIRERDGALTLTLRCAAPTSSAARPHNVRRRASAILRAVLANPRWPRRRCASRACHCSALAERASACPAWNRLRARRRRVRRRSPRCSRRRRRASRVGSPSLAGDRSLPIAELDARANRIARHCGLGRRRRTRRSVSCSIASPTRSLGLLGVLKAGGAYVPISAGDHPLRARCEQ